MEKVNNIIRQSWREFLKKNATKIVLSLVVIFLLILTISLSLDIDIDNHFPSTDSSSQFIILIIVSSCSFLILLAGVLKTFIFDNAETLGLKNDDGYKNVQTLTFTLLTMFFTSCIYFLLDVALQDAYLQLLPVLVFEFFLNQLQLSFSGFTDTTGGEFYQTARNILFEILLFFIVIYLIFAMVMILTRNGRSRIYSRFRAIGDEDEQEVEQEDNPAVYKLLAFIVIPPLDFFLLTYFSDINQILFGIIAIIVIITSIWWIYQLSQAVIDVLWRGARITPFLTSVNFLLIVPPIIAFWIVPVIASSIFIIITELSENSNALSLSLVLDTISGEIFNFPNIIFFDFIIFTGVATIIIGFAEGASFLSIIRAIKDGVGVSKTGKPSVEQAPKIALWTQYLLLFGVWISYSITSLKNVWERLQAFNIDLPEFPFPGMLNWLTNNIVTPLSDFIENQIPTLIVIMIPLIALIIPMYFILSTSFKFLSINVITPKIKNLDYFIVLVSATFVLIIIQILGDLWTLEIANAPLRILHEGEFFRDSLSLLLAIEGFCFYIGFVAIFYFLIKRKQLHES